MTIKARDFSGYQQYRWGRAWKFYVCSFDGTTSGQAAFCNVLRADGTQEQVHIDEQDRILICGKRYGRTHWHH